MSRPDIINVTIVTNIYNNTDIYIILIKLVENFLELKQSKN